jgi:hypothetical protein
VTDAPPTSGWRGPVARAAAALFAAGIAALSLFGLWFLAALPSRLPSPSDWQRVAQRLQRESLPGDAVALAPWWAERARAVLPATLPVLASPRLGGEDLPGVRRVWVVAIPAAPGGEGPVEQDLARRGARAVAAEREGALALSRFDLAAPVVPLFRLSERLDEVVAALGGRPCAREGEAGFRCDGRGGPRVSRQVREVDFLPRTCVVVEPSPSGRVLTLALADVPLGRTLRVLTGLVGEPAIQLEAPVEVRVGLDGQEARATEERPGAPGWHRLDVDTASRGGRATLTLSVRAGRGHARPLCLEAYALP